MMSYIKSDKINIFPLNKTRDSDLQDNLLYESNIANIIRQLIDVDGFIISAPDEMSNVSANSPLVFNLYGYYIKIVELPEDIKAPLYFYIKLENKDNLQEIEGQDTDNEYTGLVATDDINSIPGTAPYIYIYDDKGNLVSTSLKKFDFNSLAITGIDGKR